MKLTNDAGLLCEISNFWHLKCATQYCFFVKMHSIDFRNLPTTVTLYQLVFEFKDIIPGNPSVYRVSLICYKRLFLSLLYLKDLLSPPFYSGPLLLGEGGYLPTNLNNAPAKRSQHFTKIVLL